MDFTDMKIYFINTVVLALTMSEIETGLKIVLLVCTITYTIQKTRKIK